MLARIFRQVVNGVRFAKTACFLRVSAIYLNKKGTSQSSVLPPELSNVLLDKARLVVVTLAGCFLFVTVNPSVEEVQNNVGENLCYQINQQQKKIVLIHSSLQNQVIRPRCRGQSNFGSKTAI